ncbi:hypothetical protein [Polaribacter sp. Hel1_85]|nr:hypothetical protein [Polaribacter sp. Hel1_85]KGL58630.1 hypothetical protein PHEL85_2894 [Polaribacter sp. Hel1_85]
MKKQPNSIVLKVLPFLQKKQEKKVYRDYATLVRHFKSRVQME